MHRKTPVPPVRFSDEMPWNRLSAHFQIILEKCSKTMFILIFKIKENSSSLISDISSMIMFLKIHSVSSQKHSSGDVL